MPRMTTADAAVAILRRALISIWCTRVVETPNRVANASSEGTWLVLAMERARNTVRSLSPSTSFVRVRIRFRSRSWSIRSWRSSAVGAAVSGRLVSYSSPASAWRLIRAPWIRRNPCATSSAVSPRRRPIR